MSVRVHVASFLSLARPISCSIRGSVSQSTTEVQVTLGSFLLDPQIIGVQMTQFAQAPSGHNGEGCASISQYHSVHMRVHRYESHRFGGRSH